MKLGSCGNFRCAGLLASAVGFQRLVDEGLWGFGGAGTATLTSSTLELKVFGLPLVWPPPDLGPPTH